MSLFQSLWRKLWHAPPSWHRSLLLYPFALTRAWLDEDLPESARALVYMTLLTLVPLLAVAFALLHGFGVEGVIEPWLANLFAPMGDAGAQVVAHLITFVNQTKAGSLGIIGIVFLFVSVMGLAQRIEAVLNRIWAVEHERDLHVRITGYLGAVLLAPLMLGALMTTVFGMQNAPWLQPYTHIPAIRQTLEILTGLLPVLIAFLILTGIYIWIPNCRVRFLPALAGAAFFLALWFPVSWVFTTFIASSANYSAIYSGFANIVILLIWLNFLWLLFLLGAKVAMLTQRPQERSPYASEHWHGNEQTESAIALMTAILAAFRDGRPAYTLEPLADAIHSTPRKTGWLLQRLVHANLLTPSADHPPRYLPNRAIASYTLHDIHAALAPQTAAPALLADSQYPGVRERYLQTLDTEILKK
ncbi:MAG: YihY/virulence factor BrkB family protein [Cardiobacteriaceae bacterium]|nr:YihY/virulence factor BrkB family protein [Cardiobacteriaceae bacterium]